MGLLWLLHKHNKYQVKVHRYSHYREGGGGGNIELNNLDYIKNDRLNYYLGLLGETTFLWSGEGDLRSAENLNKLSINNI